MSMTTLHRVLVLTFISIWLLSGQQSPEDPLVRLLVSKGVLTESEVQSLGSTSSGSQRLALASLLLRKGLISPAEYDSLAAASAPAKEPVLVASTSMETVAKAIPALPAPLSPPLPAPQNQPPASALVAANVAPPFIPAVAPLRVLPVDPIKRESIIPDVRLGSGARLKIYGFFKASAINDSSSPRGDDFPLPGFLSDTGPNTSPEFHMQARSARIGIQLEGLDPSPDWTITGRMEADWEGNFSRADNRNISTIRSNMLSLRLAYLRLDHRLSDKTNAFFVGGQDWTPFGSSTLPNTVETTGLALGFGTLYERLPQMRVGLTHDLGGSRHWKFTPEFAVTMPAFGNDPTDVGNQLGYGERQGSDSDRPEVQGRVVLQWQLDRAPGVAPAQLIASATQGERKAIVLASAVPAAFKSAFPNGASVSSSRYGYSLEAQLPTRFFTLQGKFFNGEDLRFYFVGELYSNFNDTAGLTGTATAASVDGASNVIFGMRNGVATVAPQRGVRTDGGFAELGIPLSRIFNANPSGRNAGWSANFHASLDDAFARDTRRLGSGRGRSDWEFANMMYKMNNFITFMLEESYYHTRAADNSNLDFGGLPLLRGIPSRSWHDTRTELSAQFSF